jgi:hypothetical protein
VCGFNVCFSHFCQVCLTEREYDDECGYNPSYCSMCDKSEYTSEKHACQSCDHDTIFISRNGNCLDCECSYCDTIHCTRHKCVICDRIVMFNRDDIIYCYDHSCKQCIVEPVSSGRFCTKCSVNRKVGALTKRAD